MPRRIAVLIGNQTFGAESGLRELRGPANDVTELAELLSDQTRGQFDQVIPLIDKTRFEIVEQLEVVLGQEAAADDTVLIFYAGHGKLDSRGKLCLATADTKSTALNASSIKTSILGEMAGESRCPLVVLLLDCCYSGAIGGTMGSRGDLDSALKVSADKGLYILTASTGAQTAAEIEDNVGGKFMGKFTRTIADGIRSGAADHNQDGRITLLDLKTHVQRKLTGQSPQYFAYESEGDPIIALAQVSLEIVQQRTKRLVAWRMAGSIGDEYLELIDIASGIGAPALVAEIGKLLDHPNSTAKAVLAYLRHSRTRPEPANDHLPEGRKPPPVASGPLSMPPDEPALRIHSGGGIDWPTYLGLGSVVFLLLTAIAVIYWRFPPEYGYVEPAAYEAENEVATDSTVLPAAIESLDIEPLDIEPKQTPSTANDQAAIADGLRPEVRGLATQLITQAGARGIQIRLMSGFRSPMEQQGLVSRRLSRAKLSAHMTGLAFDVVRIENGVVVVEPDKYEEVGKVGKELGLVWGGDWTPSRDVYHFEAARAQEELDALREAARPD